jgi:hypothetical protein
MSGEQFIIVWNMARCWQVMGEEKHDYQMNKEGDAVVHLI